MIAPDTLLQNRYLVQKQIGQGGMGAVYVATDQRFGSTVALKETFFDDPNLRKAFEREARLLNHLRHPALPRVSDHFVEEDGQFLVMEFIPGADLSEMLKEKKAPFPLASVLDWADQLLDALDYLHTHEPPVIHRDIKPQNLKLTARNHIVLLDFGLAKGTPLQAASRVTATGSLFGYSFNYAPLEQMQGAGTDPRSDLYSLGATLYHLLTNVTPPDALTRATAMVNAEPDPLRPANEVHSQVSAPVARVLMRAMAQSAAQRPQTAAEMREDLREARRQLSTDDAQAIVQPTADAKFHERDTQLLGARDSNPAAEAATNVKGAGTAAAALHEAATVIQPAAPAGKSSPPTAHTDDDESVVTRVKSTQSQAPQRSLSGRTLGIVISVVLLAVVAAGALYVFKRQSTTQSPSVQPLPTASEQAQPTATAPAEAQNPAPLPEPSATPATTQQANDAPKKIIIRKNTKPGAKEQPEEPDDVEPDIPETPDEPDVTRHPGLSPEQRAEIAEEIKRAKQAAREGEQRRKEALRLQRERQRERLRNQRRQQPTPPPY
ncbi:MAG TPA: protein kinase [Pyrinomonadaceae bacterium]|jgi:serine/threonine protein kinase